VSDPLKEETMYTRNAVFKFTTICITTIALTALPAVAHAARVKVAPRASVTLAKWSGYGTPDGSKPVRRLQRRLQVAGERPGPVDGRFGPLTEAAVVRYQQRTGLAADGIVGPKTWAALRHPTPLVGPGAGYGATKGSTAVRSVQHSLRLAGTHPGTVDGQFGPKTEAAVIRFQRRHGIAADGVVGAVTMAALKRDLDRVEAKRSRQARRTPATPVASQPPVTNARTDSRVAGSAVDPTSLPLVLLAFGALVALGAAAALALPRTGGRRRRSEAAAWPRAALPLAAAQRPEIDGLSADGGPVLGYVTVDVAADGEVNSALVADLAKVGTSARNLGELLDWLFEAEASLVATAPTLQTVDDGYRLRAVARIEVPEAAERLRREEDVAI
jgi:peptidoglycan hydrolase-like protein with peptidoglycan-binding domain